MATVDLHVHSTASDGQCAPTAVVREARRVGLGAIALTDHDTLQGVREAQTAGEELGVRVIGGCEFSVMAWFGELHLLGYFLPPDAPELDRLFGNQRQAREDRARRIRDRLEDLGVGIPWSAIEREASDAAGVARPHIARAMVSEGVVESVTDAFDRYLSDRGPAFVGKEMPDVSTVATVVRDLGGVTSAAHLKDRAGKTNLRRLRDAGVDGVEVLHPSHDPTIIRSLDTHAARFGMLRTGGSDWHGNGSHRRVELGSQQVPEAWLDRMQDTHDERIRAGA